MSKAPRRSSRLKVAWQPAGGAARKISAEEFQTGRKEMTHMIRKTVLGIAAAIALAASATAATAAPHFGGGSGGYYPHFHHHPGFGFGFGGGYEPYYGGYDCGPVFAGFSRVWTGHGWARRPVYRSACDYY